MEPYIRKNTDLRKLATSSFEKDFFKLMNNSGFGKTIENIRKRQNVVIVDNRKLANKLSSKPNFERVTIFDENLIACHMKQTEVYFNKPIFVGQAILDLSKTLMFDFHYNYIRKKYGDKAELLFKGVKKNVIKKSLSFEDYKKCLFTEEEVMKEMNIIRSQNHEIFSMTVNKVALSSNDDKRLICENKIDTLALR